MYKTITSLVFLILTFLCLPVQAISNQWFEKNQQNNTYKLDTNTLSHFYQSTTPIIWLNNQQVTHKALDALKFIANSSQHGLNPNNYHYSIMRQLKPSRDSMTAHKFDILLSDGLLKLVHDLSVGHLDAKKADPDWFIPQREFNSVTFLKNALLKPNLKSELESLAPTSMEYIKLMDSLAHYQRYITQGGWKEIPTSPSLRLGDSHTAVPFIQKRLAFEFNYSPTNTSTYDIHQEHAVRKFQKKYGLKVDGILGKNTREAMNVSANSRAQQIKVALERRRWMPPSLGQRHLFINLANYQLKAVENGKEKLLMRVIVGRKSRQTPSFSSEMNHIVINPYWNVPRKLAVKDLLPKQQDDLNYFYLRGIRIFSRDGNKKTELDPYSIDWRSLNKNNFPYTLRQDPGEQNALGRIKFLFPNDWAIYLHDTNHRSLFKETMRSLSSGCIRVEDPIALANFSLANNLQKNTIIGMIENKKNRGRRISDTLPIYAAYFTVWLNDNEINFSPDIYQRDKRMAKNL